MESWITLILVTSAVVFTFYQLQPALLFANTTPSGGDMGAHVWGPDYIRRALLPQGRLTGWSPDWYAGFPAYTFYFPLPALAIVALDLVLPYGIAFKLITVAGILSLPVAAWALGQLAGLRFPGPALLAVSSVGFLFERGFTIYGGNIASTLAGEFGFSIGLSLAVIFLGVVARGLDTGRHRGLAAVLLALTGLSHLLPTIFAVAGACVLLLLRPAFSRLRFLAGALGVGGLLAAFWSFPFLMRLPYSNDMGWTKLTDYSAQLFPQNLRWLTLLAAVGALCSIALWNRVGMLLVTLAAGSAAVFIYAPQARLWNARALPFWFLCLYLLAGVGLSEVGPALMRGFASEPSRPGLVAKLATPVAVGLAAWMFLGLPLGVLPSWLPKPKTTDTSFIPGWAEWNYSGYERKAAYPEYKAIVDTMAGVGKTRGCGRAHWEYEEGQNRFGTPMALMLLPYWTQGCIGSMEGLYFESSATTPYHFLSAGVLSAKPSNPQRGLPYASDRPDLNLGIRQLQMLGARYYMAFSPDAVAQADRHPDLTLVASSNQWRVYEIAGSELVSGLDNQPAVLAGIGKDPRAWLGVASTWFMDPNEQEVFLAASGPKSWSRVAANRDASVASGEDVTAGITVATPQAVPVPAVKVSGIRSDNANISFDVDRVGSPVLVKTSYFPNWKASGAQGPWRVTPNLMVVVPTSRHVTLHYGWTPVEMAAWLMTFTGTAILVLWRRGRRRKESGSDDGSTSTSIEGEQPSSGSVAPGHPAESETIAAPMAAPSADG